MQKKYIATAAQMREIDRWTIEEFGIPGIVLMENAGKAVADIIQDLSDDSARPKVVIVAGKGNNGGDGFVVARHLWNWGFDVQVILLTQWDTLRGDAQINAVAAKRMEIPIIEVPDLATLNFLNAALSDADIIVDAIFGTGLATQVIGFYKSAIEAINDSDALIVSIDVPSGLQADANFSDGTAVVADVTVTLGLLKPALVLYPSSKFAGQVITVDISIPCSAVDKLKLPGSILFPGDLQPVFHPREPDSHKGSFGHLLIIAGSPGKTGAAVLAAQAALKAGAGLVSVAIPNSLNPILENKLTEAMSIPLPSNDGYHFDLSSLAAIKDNLSGKTAVLIGPGIGTKPETAKMLQKLLPELNVPVILDADALNILSDTDSWPSITTPMILTPHPGEMSRLLKSSAEEVLRNQLTLIPQFAREHSVYIVFKTARSIIANPQGEWIVNITGNPGLASGGTGDVLAGMISGYITQKFNLLSAICTGVLLHGLSADEALYHMNETQICASNILEYLPDAWYFVEEYPETFEGSLIPYLSPEEGESENE